MRLSLCGSAHHSPGAGVQRHRQEQKARPGRHLTDVGNIQLIRMLGGEVAPHEIGCRRRLRAPLRCDRSLAAADAGQAGLAHKPGDPPATAARPREHTMRSNRSGRHPAPGTAWQSDMRPGSLSKNAKISLARNRSPARTRARLLPRYPAQRASACCHAEVDAIPGARRWSDRRGATGVAV